jgi:hypothetical protein
MLCKIVHIVVMNDKKSANFLLNLPLLWAQEVSCVNYQFFEWKYRKFSGLLILILMTQWMRGLSCWNFFHSDEAMNERVIFLKFFEYIGIRILSETLSKSQVVSSWSWITPKLFTYMYSFLEWEL